MNSLKRVLPISVVCIWALPSNRAVAQVLPSGSVTGVILAAGGKPVTKATVNIRTRDAAAARTNPFSATTTTAGDGSFTFASVPDGNYLVCPEARADKLIAPCDWAAEPAAIVAGGKATTMPAITLKAGVELWIRVDDPSQKRASSEGKVRGAAMLIFVRTAGARPIPIPQTSVDSSGFDHRLTVPVDTNLIVSAYSSGFDLANMDRTVTSAAGNPRGFTIPLSIPSGTAQRKETIRVE